MAFITREASRQLSTVSSEWLYNSRLYSAVGASSYQKHLLMLTSLVKRRLLLSVEDGS